MLAFLLFLLFWLTRMRAQTFDFNKKITKRARGLRLFDQDAHKGGIFGQVVSTLPTYLLYVA